MPNTSVTIPVMSVGAYVTAMMEARHGLADDDFRRLQRRDEKLLEGAGSRLRETDMTITMSTVI